MRDRFQNAYGVITFTSDPQYFRASTSSGRITQSSAGTCATSHHIPPRSHSVPATVTPRPFEALMAKALTLRGFSNFGSSTVQNHAELRAALGELSEMTAMPHFPTKLGKTFGLEEMNEALDYVGEDGAKAVVRLG